MTQGAGAESGGSGSAKTDLPPDLLAVLGEEFNELHGSTDNQSAGTTESGLKQLYERIHKLDVPRAAVCLSGGGIRSASFALGVLQALARHGLLGQFHYLSTVSGGGYIGSFLSAWRRNLADDRMLFSRLGGRGSGYPIDPTDDLYAETGELQGIRANSNFLTPRLGALSGDTLTVAALYLRNFLLNWLVFLPLFLAIIVVPHLCYDVQYWAQEASETLQTALALGGLGFLSLALLALTAGRPARDVRASGDRRFHLSSALWIVVPTFAAGACFALYEAHWIKPAIDVAPAVYLRNSILGALLYAAVWIVGFVASSRRLAPGGFFGTRENPVPPLQELVCWVVSGAIAGAIITAGHQLFGLLRAMADAPGAPFPLDLLFQDGNHLFLLVAAGVAWVMVSVLLADLFFTGLTSYTRSGDADREWSARAAGFLAGSALGWFLFAAIVLYGPPAFVWFNKWALAALGGVSGIATLGLGGSAATAATAARKASQKLSLTQLLRLVTIVFVVLLGIVLSRFARSILDGHNEAFGIENAGLKAILAGVVWIACMLMALAASYFVNVNRFSLHAVYRNRLVRAFLGSARANAKPERAPDPFTGFDPGDNVALASLWTSGGNNGRRCLFHVINTALNIVEPANLAWQERMAESFAMTPLYCGNPIVGFAPTVGYGDPRGGISLGTAVAISGAAASPNQGYHSSPIVGLLMMLFNVRLGWWLGNPRRGQPVYEREGPMLSVGPIIDELMSRTTDTGKYVYLSDGGHFDNLGLYEMVRRRCHIVLVSDAGCDPQCALEDLGNAVRKIWIDFGVRIEFDRIEIAGRATPPVDGTYCALGRICYPEPGAKQGILIYMKPAYHGTEPADVRAYAAGNPTFPHETTADQWFSESQLESYRSLGNQIVDLMCFDNQLPECRTYKALSMTEFVSRTREYVRKSRPPERSCLGATEKAPGSGAQPV